MVQVSGMHGNAARARVFAEEYAALKRAGEGTLSAAVEEGEECAGQQKGNASSVDDVPKGLGREEFERWMFRENAWVDI